VFDEAMPTDYSRILAELLDTALADNWNEASPTMALLWQASDDPDDLGLAVKNLEGSVEEELARLESDWGYLAVAHSEVTCQPPSELLSPSDEGPVRITIAVDHDSRSGVLRHRNGTTQWFGAAVDLPLARLLRARLWLEPAA
jgi:hypothetical protein